MILHSGKFVTFPFSIMSLWRKDMQLIFMFSFYKIINSPEICTEQCCKSADTVDSVLNIIILTQFPTQTNSRKFIQIDIRDTDSDSLTQGFAHSNTYTIHIKNLNLYSKAYNMGLTWNSCLTLFPRRGPVNSSTLIFGNINLTETMTNLIATCTFNKKRLPKFLLSP